MDSGNILIGSHYIIIHGYESFLAEVLDATQNDPNNPGTHLIYAGF